MSNAQDCCPQCQRELELERRAGLVLCTVCGASLPPVESPKSGALENAAGLTDTERRRLHICFWLLLVAVPGSVALVLLASNSNFVPRVLPVWLVSLFPPWFRCVLCATTCAAGAAYCLCKLRGLGRHWVSQLVYVVSWTILLLIATALVCVGLVLGGCYFLGLVP